MTLAHQAPPPATSPSSPSPQQQSKHHHQPQLHHQTHAPPQSYDIPELPPPPPWHPNGGDDIMRAWLLAKAETEKRRAEEERTHQDTIRLEQRRTEHDILRTSLAGGIPPPMVPIVFAGMGGGNLPQAALEWAHQFIICHLLIIRNNHSRSSSIPGTRNIFFQAQAPHYTSQIPHGLMRRPSSNNFRKDHHLVFRSSNSSNPNNHFMDKESMGQVLVREAVLLPV
ncbi:hypothetical protein SEPCBS119000_002536 [Sporothrix epigloea]|uniref:Uncharacterized protein n=1 Tax=Sporothrix epigloea TaxID=1892477 RepID=A0ABP0DIE6_9PEZI